MSTPEEIRKRRDDCLQAAHGMTKQPDSKAVLIAIESAMRVEGVYFLSEIAAQLAELNQTLNKVVEPYGNSHVVQVAPAPSDVTVHY